MRKTIIALATLSALSFGASASDIKCGIQVSPKDCSGWKQLDELAEKGAQPDLINDLFDAYEKDGDKEAANLALYDAIKGMSNEHKLATFAALNNITVSQKYDSLLDQIINGGNMVGDNPDQEEKLKEAYNNFEEAKENGDIEFGENPFDGTPIAEPVVPVDQLPGLPSNQDKIDTYNAIAEHLGRDTKIVIEDNGMVKLYTADGNGVPLSRFDKKTGEYVVDERIVNDIRDKAKKYVKGNHGDLIVDPIDVIIDPIEGKPGIDPIDVIIDPIEGKPGIDPIDVIIDPIEGKPGVEPIPGEEIEPKLPGDALGKVRDYVERQKEEIKKNIEERREEREDKGIVIGRPVDGGNPITEPTPAPIEDAPILIGDGKHEERKLAREEKRAERKKERQDKGIVVGKPAEEGKPNHGVVDKIKESREVRTNPIESGEPNHGIKEAAEQAIADARAEGEEFVDNARSSVEELYAQGQANVTANSDDIKTLFGEVDRLDEKMDSVVASAHAITNAKPTLMSVGSSAIGVGVGYAGDAAAIAVGVAHSFDDNWAASATLNATTGSYSEVSAGAGVQYAW